MAMLSQMSASTARSARARLLAPLALLALSATLLVPGLGRMAARDTTDARYLEVAREMVASGDWLVPHLAGVPHLHKPPLSYWAAAAGFRTLGVSPFAGRLLAQLALAATALLLFAWTRAHHGSRPAWIAAGVFLTSGLVFASSRGLNTDLFQLFFLTAGLLALCRGSEGRAGPTALGVGLLVASMLAKGPIALLVGLCVFGPFLVLRRGERRLPASGVAAGIAAGCAVALPWYATLVASDPSLLRWFFEHQVVARVSGGAEGHLHGLLYLPAHFLIGWLPWTPLVARSVWQLRPRSGVRTAAPELFLLLWLLVPCLLFELFATKLATYLLPAFPAGALLVARASARGELDDPAGRLTVAASAALAGVAALALAAFLATPSMAPAARSWLEPDQLAAPALFAACLAALGAAALALAAAARRRATAWSLPRIVAVTALTFAVGFAGLAPGLPDHEADAAIVRSVPGSRVIQHGLFESGLFFYTADLERVFVAVERRRAALARRDPRAARLGLRYDQVAAMVAEDVPTFVLAKHSAEAKLVEQHGLVAVRHSPRYALLANTSAAAALARTRLANE